MLFAIVAGAFFSIQNSAVQTFIIRQITANLSEKLNANIKIGKVDIDFFDTVILKDVLIEGQNSDTILYTKSVSAKIDSLKFKRHRLVVNELLFDSSYIEIEIDTTNRFNFIYILDSLETGKKKKAGWLLTCNSFGFNNTTISYKNFHTLKDDDFFINNLNLNIADFENIGDSVSFKIKDFSFNDGQNLFLKHLSAEVITTPNSVNIGKLTVKSKRSNIEDSRIELNLNNDSTNIKPDFDFHFNRAEISFRELAELIPSFRGMDETVKISGRIYGTIDDIKGKNIVLKTGKSTKAVLDFYLNGIKNPETMYMFLDLKQSATTFSDISAFNLPKTSSVKHIEFPKSFYDAGTLNFTGNFSGFLTDFVAFGTLKSNMGTLSTDLSLAPEGNGVIRYNGNIKTTDFNIGELLNDSVFGNVTFEGKADGVFNKRKQTVSGFYKGKLTKFDINGYTYNNIKLEGLLADKMFDGLMAINDTNLQFAFLGRIDLNPEIPVFKFNLELDKLQLGNLNLSKKYPESETAFKMKANFAGNKLDNLKGSLVFTDGFYKNRNGIIDFDGIKLKSVPDDSTKNLTLTSDFFDIEIDGKYHFQSLLYTIKKDIKKFFPSVKYELPKNEEINKFEYRISAKDLDKLAEVFVPGLRFETPFLIYGTVDSEKSDFELSGSIPSFIYKDLLFENIFIFNKTVNNKYKSKFRFGTIEHRNGDRIYNFSVESDAAENTLNNLISWENNPDSTSHSHIKLQSSLNVSDSSGISTIKITGFPSEVYLADTRWNIDSFNIDMHPSNINVAKFRVYNQNQSITVNGNISKDSTDILSVNFDNIVLGYLEKYLKKDISLSGTINGSVDLSNIYNNASVISNITIDTLIYKGHLFGDVSLISNWDKENKRINSELKIERDSAISLLANGYYKPASNSINYNVKADKLDISLLGSIIQDNLSGFEGTITGDINIGGTLKKIELNGAIMADSAGVTVDYTKTHYTFNDSVYFISDVIKFDKITIADKFGNTGIFDGTLTHQNFGQMVYDLSLESKKILVLNTTQADNEIFYGKGFCNGKFTITGKGVKVALNGSATTLAGTDINISMEYESDIESYDFIKFVKHEKPEKRKFYFKNEDKKERGEFTLAITMEVTPEAKFQLIYNSQIGDLIKAQGEGIFFMKMDKDYNISLSGDFTVTEGDYLFTLKNILSKRFILNPGGKIVWSGDPYNARLDLTAVYKVKAALSDLMMESSLVSDKDIYHRIPVECKILLSEDLTDPVINFEIDFPEEDESLKGVLQQYINTEEEMNKQILSLIVMGKFYTPEYMRGQYDTSDPNLIGNTASELFSNQLSNWLSQINNNVDVGFNYRPGNSITDDEIELALSTQIFNDRVILNGNIGNNVNPESSNSSQIVGDFDIKVKLTPSGKIMFKAFNRSNNDLIYDTAPYTQGIGFSVKEEYDTIGELFYKIGEIFRRKDKKKKK